MAETKNFKRGGDHHNPVNTKLPEEYVVLVGSPTDTYKGWANMEGYPKTVAGVPRYLREGGGTHDIYWANFLDPAPRLFWNGIAQPQPGDLVTILVVSPGFLRRQRLDWEASPYNRELHPRPLQPKKEEPRGWIPFRNPDPPVVPAKPSTQDPEYMINHEIMMRTTSDNAPGVIRRPTQARQYEEIIHNLPRAVIFGPDLGGEARLPDVLVKVVLIRTVDEFVAYMKDGTVSGERWQHAFDVPSFETAAPSEVGRAGPIDEDHSYYDFAVAPSSKAWAIRWAKLKATHAKPQAVNRRKVKIKRFDYFGHSFPESFEALFGWPNKQETWDYASTFARIPRSAMTANSFAHLWGCSLAQSMAWDLVRHFRKIRAAESLTTYKEIPRFPTSMPVPDEGWVERDRTMKRPPPPPPPPPGSEPEWVRWNSERGELAAEAAH